MRKLLFSRSSLRGSFVSAFPKGNKQNLTIFPELATFSLMIILTKVFDDHFSLQSLSIAHQALY